MCHSNTFSTPAEESDLDEEIEVPGGGVSESEDNWEELSDFGELNGHSDSDFDEASNLRSSKRGLEEDEDEEQEEEVEEIEVSEEEDSSEEDGESQSDMTVDANKSDSDNSDSDEWEIGKITH